MRLQQPAFSPLFRRASIHSAPDLTHDSRQSSDAWLPLSEPQVAPALAVRPSSTSPLRMVRSAPERPPPLVARPAVSRLQDVQGDEGAPEGALLPRDLDLQVTLEGREARRMETTEMTAAAVGLDG